jgi:hypothetical protein
MFIEFLTQNIKSKTYQTIRFWHHYGIFGLLFFMMVNFNDFFTFSKLCSCLLLTKNKFILEYWIYVFLDI